MGDAFQLEQWGWGGEFEYTPMARHGPRLNRLSSVPQAEPQLTNTQVSVRTLGPVISTV